MIDLISFRGSGLTEKQVNDIVFKNSLQKNSRAGIIYYDNQMKKNMDGFYLKVSIDGFKLECSLHKFYNYVKKGKQANFNLFTFINVEESVLMLGDKTGIDIKNTKVHSLEIGLNLYVSNDCREYLDKIRSIGPALFEKEFFVNSKFKDKRQLNTLSHKDIRKVYKVYDKVFEMRDRKRNDTPEGINILRIETINRRIDNLTTERLFSPQYIKELLSQFERDWRTIQFDRTIEAPKGTGTKKKNLCKEILINGTNKTLLQAKDQYNKGGLTEKEFRTIREFIEKDWNIFKTKITSSQTIEEQEFRELLKMNIINVNH